MYTNTSYFGGNMNTLCIGADPEIFVGDVNGPRSIIGMIGGTKENPLPLPMLGDGFAVQEDNVALEYNIPPSPSREAFVSNISTMMSFLRQSMKDSYGFNLLKESAISFPDSELSDPRALVFGCDPDFNAWSGLQLLQPLHRRLEHLPHLVRRLAPRVVNCLARAPLPRHQQPKTREQQQSQQRRVEAGKPQHQQPHHPIRQQSDQVPRQRSDPRQFSRQVLRQIGRFPLRQKRPVSMQNRLVDLPREPLADRQNNADRQRRQIIGERRRADHVAGQDQP